ncbi:MAG: glycosyltransferase family 4 protein [Sediminicola sp.]|tara:strand:+ start:5174 stop:6454 length:1281 start_codon:yes stop_codon:yes gene_type:complete
MEKVLIVTYYWPPAGGPGVQRWLKFVKYMKDFGMEPVVYIPKNPHYPLRDESFLGEVPKDLTVYSMPIWEPYGLSGVFSKKKTKRISSGIITSKEQSFMERAMLWVRGNLFVPDARKYWVRPSIKFLHKKIAEENVKTIITTGPPHSLHLIGLGLKRVSGVQWIADFRDPWTSIGYHKKLKLGKRAEKKHAKLESLVLNGADKVIVTSNTTKKEFEGITKSPIQVITNGFDGKAPEFSHLDSKFTISHIGSLLSGRNPIGFWKVLQELIRENKDFAEHFRLQLIGVVSEDVLETIESFGISPYITVTGYLSHTQALQKQQRSQVLLLVEMDEPETMGIIPGKLFEYMMAKRPILALGPVDWEVGTIIAETQTGSCFGYTDTQEVKQLLLKWFQAYRNGGLHIRPMDIDSYSRRELTRKLVDFIRWE